PLRPSDLVAAHLKQPKVVTSAADVFVHKLLGYAAEGPHSTQSMDLQMAVSIEMETKVYPADGPFQDPDTHTLTLTIHPTVPAPPLVISMDLYTGNDVEAPDAPLWASALRKGHDNVVELACAGHWLRQLALRMAGHTRLGWTEEALRWWSVVKYCDSYLKLHRGARAGVSGSRRRPTPRPQLGMLERMAEKVGGYSEVLEALRYAKDLVELLNAPRLRTHVR
ncbi:hypothetical protein C8Q76DRAFT_613440, partial [Earliella scabrosa]